MHTHEAVEWRREVAALTETEREINADAHRAARGVIGDKEDDQ